MRSVTAHPSPVKALAKVAATVLLGTSKYSAMLPSRQGFRREDEEARRA